MKRSHLLGALIGIVFVAALPFFIKDEYTLGFLVLAGIVSLIVTGLNMLVGHAGQLSLGHGGFYAIGAYASTILTIRFGFTPFPALIVAAIATGLVALLLGIPLLKMLTQFHLAVATLIFVMLINAILIVGGGWTGGFTGIQGQPPFSIGPIVFEGDVANYYLVWGVVFLGILFAAGLSNSQAGRVLRAIQGDETGAQSLGIDVAWEKVKVFVISAIYASVAGSLLAHYTGSVTPAQFGVGPSLEFMVMVFLGGRGSVIGGVVGGTFIKLLPQVTEFMKNYRLLVDGLILTGVLLFVPQGIVGLFKKIWDRRPGGKSPEEAASLSWKASSSSVALAKPEAKGE
ncbi:MAG TPA: branched-chain amino acid ABC transporter permease [Thermodesulfobacteriota bacterium]|nr:branched-chain amino acid ABC transporter permease [Thermodesulfobacteriota bacterium]